MQFLVNRCTRNKIIFSVLALMLATLLAWCLVTVLEQYVKAQQAQESALTVSKPHKSLEQRKRDITAYLAAKYKKQTLVVRNYVDLAFHEADKHPDVEPELILAIIQKESSMGHKLHSNYGAEGVMQVVRRFHKEKVAHKESLMNPKVNIRVGAKILQEYIAQKGDIRPALVKYSGNADGYADFVLREKAVLKSI